MHKLTELALFTDDVEETADFYEQLLGLPPAVKAHDLVIFKPGGLTLLIHYRYPEDTGQPPNQDHIAVSVTDLDAVCRDLAAQGMELLVEPRHYSWGLSAYLRDPDGRLIELTEQSNPAQKD
jgi:catechol 2,3-dioxygenase-like lactoylglutathione lyase family enzyme